MDFTHLKTKLLNVKILFSLLNTLRSWKERRIRNKN